MSAPAMGSLLVAIAAILWASDGLFRYPLIQKGFDPIWLVLIDHLICTLILFPILFLKHKRALFQMTKGQWAALFFLGGGASALATILFSASFRYVNPSVSILLQKMQPVFVVLLAMIFLGERPRRTFWFWGLMGLVAGLVISFPQLEFGFAGDIRFDSKGPILALSAAGLWGLATVIGKGVLRSLSPWVVTAWRYAFGLFTLVWMVLITGSSVPALTMEPETLKAIGYMSLVPGLLAMLSYYNGMLRTQASTVTFIELLFPVSAVALNTIFLHTPLNAVQAVAGIVLLFCVTQISAAGGEG